jgi:molybdopterin-biosynthesis enzyme MoeA-like protein
LGVSLALHPEAKVKIQERICDMAKADGKEADLHSPENLHRLKMGEFPVGAQIIPNPYNKIPGFSIKNFQGVGAHYFLPGFPVMAWPMMEWVLDTYYYDAIYQGAKEERAVIVWGQMESTLTPLMQLIEAKFPEVSVFSLPSVGDAKTERRIELGVKGAPGKLDLAFSLMLEQLDILGARYDRI